MQVTYGDVARILLRDVKESDYIEKIMRLIQCYEAEQVSPLQALVEIMNGAMMEMCIRIQVRRALGEPRI